MAPNFLYNNRIMLKIGERPDHKIYDNFGIQHTAQKCKETEIKILTSFCSDMFNCNQQLQPCTKFTAMVYMISVYTIKWHSLQNRGTQLLVSLLHHCPKVRLPYRGVCAKVLQGHHLKVVKVVDGRLASNGGVSSLRWWHGNSRRSVSPETP